MSENIMTIHQFTLGPWDNLLYILEDNETRQAALVDPAWDIESIQSEIEKRGVELTHCLITHYHYDHINMLEPFRIRYPEVQVCLLDVEADFYQVDFPQLHRLKAQEEITIGKNLKIKALHTPGHSPGSVSYLFHGHMLTGDAVFIDSCGRADFVGGDPRQLYETINWIAQNIPDDTVIHPGHGSLTRGSDSLANQKKTNPYFLFQTYEEFEAKRMDGATPGSPMPAVSPEWEEKVRSFQPSSEEGTK